MSARKERRAAKAKDREQGPAEEPPVVLRATVTPPEGARCPHGLLTTQWCSMCPNGWTG